MEDMEGAIKAIYETVFDSDLWNEAAVDCARVANSSTFFLQTLDRESGAVNVLSARGMEALSIEEYEQHFHKIDIWRDGLLAAQPGKIHLYHRIVEQNAYEGSEVFHDWVKPAVGYEIFWGMGGRFELLDRKHLAFLATHRSRKSGPLTRQEQQRFAVLLPHIQRALHFRQLLQTEASRTRRLEAVIEGCTEPLFLVDRGARLIYANSRALALATADQPALRLRRDGKLEAMTPADDLDLRKGVSDACSREQWSAQTKSCVLLHTSTGKPLMATIAPVPPDRAEAREGCALIVVRDVWSRRHVDPAKISLVFGLTAAEAQLVAKLFEGRSLRLAAVELGVAYNTVRTQLASVLAKTGASRQSELMLYVSRLAEESQERPSKQPRG
jgi:DNA-binding CsgD family transcriptional regulator